MYETSTYCSLLLRDLLCWCHLVMFSISKVQSACLMSVYSGTSAAENFLFCIGNELHRGDDALDSKNVDEG